MTTIGKANAGSFERHTGEVYGWAYRLLGRHHDALDVVQDVFLRWDAQCRKQPPRCPRGWLRRVTVNRAIDVRRQRPREQASGDNAAMQMPAPIGAVSPIERDALRSDIAAALDRLSDAQRGVLIAKVYDDMTFAQIADETGLALSTVKTHYLRAVRVLRDGLRPRWAEKGLR